MRDAMPDDAADWERWYALRMASRITGLSPDDRALMNRLEAAGFAMLPDSAPA